MCLGHPVQYIASSYDVSKLYCMPGLACMLFQSPLRLAVARKTSASTGWLQQIEVLPNSVVWR